MTKATFVVTRSPGPAWNHDKPMREQVHWDIHARFMDQLSAERFVIMGGPLVGTPDVLLIVEAENEQHARETFQRDPWTPAGILTITNLRRWSVLLDSRKQ